MNARLKDIQAIADELAEAQDLQCRIFNMMHERIPENIRCGVDVSVRATNETIGDKEWTMITVYVYDGKNEDMEYLEYYFSTTGFDDALDDIKAYLDEHYPKITNE